MAGCDDDELYPFCGSKDLGDVQAADLTRPGKWPFDRQCITRFPEDIAERVAAELEKAEATENYVSDFQVDIAPKGSGHDARHYSVTVFGEKLNGTLVDLPCYVESHLLRPGSSSRAKGEKLQSGSKVNAEDLLYKTADISQMLIVHREDILPGIEACYRGEKGLEWPSGITPATARIRETRFRKPPPKGLPVVEAAAAIKDRMENRTYKYHEIIEMEPEEYNDFLQQNANKIWVPPAPKPKRRKRLRVNSRPQP